MAAGYGRLLHIRPPVVSTGPAIQMASAGVVPGQARMYARTNGSRRMALTSQEPRDDDLMRRVAAGSADALGGLHARFARLIFAIAVRSLDRAAAEDLVQEVFLAVWRNADRFDQLYQPLDVIDPPDRVEGGDP